MPTRRKFKGVCIVQGCDRRRQSSRGLCSTHDDYHRRWGTPVAELRPIRPYAPAGQCSVPGCERQRTAKGLCHTHNKYRLKGTPRERLRPIRGRRANNERVACSVSGCQRHGAYKGMCAMHWRRKTKGVPAHMMAAPPYFRGHGRLWRSGLPFVQTSDSRRLTLRAVALRAQGLSYAQVAARLNAEGFTSSIGSALTAGTVWRRVRSHTP